MAQTQKQRLEEARDIHARFHNWMGFLVCDGEEDMLALRKLVKKIEREAQKPKKEEINMLNKLIDYADPCSWDLKSVYEDILYGLENGNDYDWIKPDKKFAKWFAERFALEVEDE